MSKRKYITFNSAILYIIAFLTTTIIHETAHAIVGLYHKSKPILHHNFVEHLSTSHLSVLEHASIAFAGPLISLLQGIIVGLIYLNSNRNKPIHLFYLWFAVLGFNNFLGYIITGPIFQSGDLGKTYLLLEAPLFVQIINTIFGAGFLLFIAYKLTKPFLLFSYKEKWVATEESRKSFSFRILILPWIIGSAIITILYLPVVTLISIIYPIMSGMVFIFPWQNSRRIKNVAISKSKKLGKPSILFVSILTILIVIFKFVLAPGIQL